MPLIYPKVLSHFCECVCKMLRWSQVCSPLRDVSDEFSYRSDSLINFIHFCPLFFCGGIRWRVDPWLPCSANCGGGSTTRSVRCMKGPEGRSREVESQHCLGTGRRPSDTRLCNLLPCARWATTHWGLVSLLTLTWTVSRLFKTQWRFPSGAECRFLVSQLLNRRFGAFVCFICFPNYLRGKYSPSWYISGVGYLL